MGAIEKAIWYLETHLEDGITLDDVADVACVSRFHLTRAFAYQVGCTPMAYLRQRRLSEAAKLLAASSEDILTIALQFDYNSHEAFTRAFRDHFDITPTEMRAAGHLPEHALTAPYRRNPQMSKQITPTRFETTPDLYFAGLPQQYAEAASPEIPGQWLKFAPYIGTIGGQRGTLHLAFALKGKGAIS